MSKQKKKIEIEKVLYIERRKAQRRKEPDRRGGKNKKSEVFQSLFKRNELEDERENQRRKGERRKKVVPPIVTPN